MLMRHSMREVGSGNGNCSWCRYSTRDKNEKLGLGNREKRMSVSSLRGFLPGSRFLYVVLNVPKLAL